MLHRNALCGVEQLIDVLFAEDPRSSAVGTVQSYVSRLRHDLALDGERLQTRPGGYSLVVDDDELDSARFEVRVAEALATVEGDPVGAAERLVEALTWWAGDRAYAEFSDDLSLQAESTRLEEVRLQAIWGLVEARIAGGDYPEAIDVLGTAVARWPLREAFRSQQMLALHRGGRQPEALQAFRRFRKDLAEHGLVPTPGLTELEGRIARQDPSLVEPLTTRQVRTVRAKPASEPRLGNLPLSVNALLGRNSELSELVPLGATARLLTLTGPGGVGKTRLALRLAEQALPSHGDGVWLCDLAGVREDSLAVEAVATSLEVQRRHGSSVLDGLVDVLQHRDLLVVFDNCEHLLRQVADLTESILQACASVRIIATSREPLDVDGETVWPLAPLALPKPGETDPIMAMESPAVAVRAVGARHRQRRRGCHRPWHQRPPAAAGRAGPTRGDDRHLQPRAGQVARLHGRPPPRPVSDRPPSIRRPRTPPRRRVLPPTPEAHRRRRP